MAFVALTIHASHFTPLFVSHSYIMMMYNTYIFHNSTLHAIINNNIFFDSLYLLMYIFLPVVVLHVFVLLIKHLFVC